MRLIDADVLKEQLEPFRYSICGFEGVLALIDNAPTIELRKGEWIKTPELFRDRICSHCKKQILYEQIGDFCIKCGAQMKGGAE